MFNTKVRRRDGWRPIQTTSGPLLLHGRRSNSTFARHRCENAQYSITTSHRSSSTDAKESLLRASQCGDTPAEVLEGDHMVSSGRLAPRSEGTRQGRRQFLRDSGGTRQGERHQSWRSPNDQKRLSSCDQSQADDIFAGTGPVSGLSSGKSKTPVENNGFLNR